MTVSSSTGSHMGTYAKEKGSTTLMSHPFDNKRLQKGFLLHANITYIYI